MRNKTINRFYYKKDRLNQLRGFCAVVQNDCSATKAGKVLNLESATIGQQIKTLEDQFNIDLFNRKFKNKLVLTEEGKKFYEIALPALQTVDGVFQNFISGLEYERNNILNIASLDAVILKMIPFLAEFKKNHQDINISTFNISKEEAFLKLANKELDLVFYASDVNEEIPIELEKAKISNYACYWVLYPEHPLAVKNEKNIMNEEIASYPFALLEDSIYIKSFENFIKEYNIKSPITMRYGTIDMIKEMVKSKLCVSILNETYITEKDKQDLVFKNTEGNFSKMCYYYFTNKNFLIKDVAKQFLEIVKQHQQEIFH
jgi:DNA-binding transcriptional LysR family regulator